MCDATKVGCEQSLCVTKCTTDTECINTSTGRKCAGGKCVQCAGDTDCPTGQQCLSGMCQAPCQTDGDCAGFQRCQAGKCIEGGCQIDRECVASTRNVEATCGTDGKCIVPCQTDLECGNPKSYSFFSCIATQIRSMRDITGIAHVNPPSTKTTFRSGWRSNAPSNTRLIRCDT